jgi:hypothetical protein
MTCQNSFGTTKNLTLVGKLQVNRKHIPHGIEVTYKESITDIRPSRRFTLGVEISLRFYTMWMLSVLPTFRSDTSTLKMEAE